MALFGQSDERARLPAFKNDAPLYVSDAACRIEEMPCTEILAQQQQRFTCQLLHIDRGAPPPALSQRCDREHAYRKQQTPLESRAGQDSAHGQLKRSLLHQAQQPRSAFLDQLNIDPWT